MFCWLIGHKWAPGYDPHFEGCLRCSKVRPKQFKGCVPCAFCAKPVTEPLKEDNFKSDSDPYFARLGYGMKFFNPSAQVKCPHCEHTLRFERDDYGKNWHTPILVVDFKMEDDSAIVTKS